MPATTLKITLSGDWVSAIMDTLMLVVAIVSAWYAYRAYQHQKDRSRKESACNLAQYYASNIIDKYSDISMVFDSAGITGVIQKAFDLRDLQNFDKEELLDFLKKSEMPFEVFEEKLTRIDPKYLLGARMSRACSADDRTNTMCNYTTSDENGGVKIINGTYLQIDFEREISGLLNELEWFAMNCQYGLADEELLYQSLHQTYLSTVWMLYFFISIRNVNNEDKLYTNVSWLFTKWRDRLVELTDAKEAERQALLEKASSVKAPVYSGSKLK